MVIGVAGSISTRPCKVNVVQRPSDIPSTKGQSSAVPARCRSPTTARVPAACSRRRR
jgi:hypothetical protein